MILIYSRSDDEQVNSVVPFLPVGSFFRIDSETSENYKVIVKFGGGPVAPVYSIANGTNPIDLQDVRVVWWRGPVPSSPDNPFSTVIDVLLALDVFWINRPSRQEESVRFPFQQEIARELAISLPLTLITSDAGTAAKFISDHSSDGVVRKRFLISEGLWIDEPILIGDVEKTIRDTPNTPLILQKKVSSNSDVFVHISEKSLVAESGVIDQLKNTAFPNLGNALKNMLSRLGLSYGTFRLSADSSGTIHFLDFTPFGDWNNITDEIRSTLAKKLSTFISTKDQHTPHGPLGEIALSLSGGGYRAAAFHLGTLRMLDELGLLEDVTKLSTVSGGTILGAKYLADNPSKADFPLFAQKFEETLAVTNVTRLAVTLLQSTTKVNNEMRTPSLIRAATSIYADQKFVGNTTLGDLRHARINEFAFNSTEFRTGNNFRFQIGKDNKVGNGTTGARIDKNVIDEISLAGIVAASSCFPGGFEPISFPSDFKWNRQLSAVKTDLGDNFAQDIDLMDGGIFDNQGIDSIKMILDRKDSNTDLIIISDASPRKSPKPLPDSKDNILKAFLRRAGNAFLWILEKIPLWLLVAAITVISLAAITSSIMIGRRLRGFLQQPFQAGELLGYMTAFLVVLPVSILFLAGLVAFILYFRTINFWIGAPGWSHFLRLRIPQLFRLLESRIASVLRMMTNIFMGKIRSDAFESVFSDGKLNRKLVANLIYDIDDKSKWENKIPAELFPVPAIRENVIRAANYPTCLDFEDRGDSNGRHELSNLIACGMATTCFNILRYLYQHRYADASIPGTPLNGLFLEVKKKWVEFNEEAPIEYPLKGSF